MKRHLPNAITCLNLLTGTLGCIEILTGDYRLAIYYVAVAGLFDFLDGFAARMLHVKSDIGKELDSLADMVSFGVLPALYMMQELAQAGAGNLRFAGLGIVVFSALRLAKFNIDTRQTDSFIGVPTPANTLLITSLVFLPMALPVWALLSLTVVACLLMVSSIPLLALKFSSFSWAGNELRFSLLGIIGISLAVFQSAAIPTIIPLYLVFSLVGNFKKSKAV